MPETRRLKFANGADLVTQLQGLITSNKHDEKVNEFLLGEEEVYVDIPTEVYGSL